LPGNQEFTVSKRKEGKGGKREYQQYFIFK
jgi:hypothetical protein